MKITTKDGEQIPVIDTANHLTAEDLEPGDVFRYARGAETNVYLKLPNGTFQFGANRFFPSPPDESLAFVIKIDAELKLGEETSKREVSSGRLTTRAQRILDQALGVYDDDDWGDDLLDDDDWDVDYRDIDPWDHF